MNKLKLLDRVEVTWGDAFHSDASYSYEEIPTLQPMLQHTIGFYLYKDKDKIVLATNWFMDESKDEKKFDRIWLIPTPWIVTIKKV